MKINNNCEENDKNNNNEIDEENNNVIDEENNLKFEDYNHNCKVFHTFVIKSITEIEDKLYLIATGIQKCLIPKIYKDELDEYLQFKYRINDEASVNDYIELRKTKTVKVKSKNNEDIDSDIATVTTNSMRLPLNIEIILNHFPFRLYKASVKIELTSKIINTRNNSNITLRPSLVYENILKLQNLIRINNNDIKAINNKPNYNNLIKVMDKNTMFDLLTPIPFIYGTDQHKIIKNSNRIITYTPIIEIGFYFYEPVLDAFFNMISPIFIILLLITSTVIIDMDDTSYLGMMVGIILAVVFVLKDMRRQSNRTTFSSTDLYIILFLSGLSISSVGVINSYLKIIGVCISWLSSIIPILGFFRYYYLTNKIINRSNEFNKIIQDPLTILESKSDIIYEDLVNIPNKENAWGYII